MKNTLITLGSILIAATMIYFASTQGETYLLDGREFVGRAESTEDSVILDVRTTAEYGAGHIASAVNIDLQSPTFVQDVSNLDKSKTYFVYCRSGNRSAEAVSLMRGAGFEKIYELRGGIMNAEYLLDNQ